ncbi:FRG domain-containing protein [Pseudomonadota bacterium]
MRNFGNTQFYCHMSLNSGELFTNKSIRHDNGLKVKSFRDLVQNVAKIANHNPDYNLFFRGQSNEYKLASGASSFYPTIFRSPGKSLRNEELSSRYALLDSCTSALISELEGLEIENYSKLKKFPELPWSILQHYGVCDTPLLDFTHSLRVAASFALDRATHKAYVYAFAFPFPSGTISYFTEDELLNVRLLSACPSIALRPHFQEGYLLGSFPSYAGRKQPSFDFGRRLIAKFEIPANEFWGEEFDEIPMDALYPPIDDVKEICKKIEADVVA